MFLDASGPLLPKKGFLLSESNTLQSLTMCSICLWLFTGNTSSCSSDLFQRRSTQKSFAIPSFCLILNLNLPFTLLQLPFIFVVFVFKPTLLLNLVLVFSYNCLLKLYYSSKNYPPFQMYFFNLDIYIVLDIS